MCFTLCLARSHDGMAIKKEKGKIVYEPKQKFGRFLAHSAFMAIWFMLHTHSTCCARQQECETDSPLIQQ